MENNLETLIKGTSVEKIDSQIRALLHEVVNKVVFPISLKLELLQYQTQDENDLKMLETDLKKTNQFKEFLGEKHNQYHQISKEDKRDYVLDSIHLLKEIAHTFSFAPGYFNDNPGIGEQYEKISERINDFVENFSKGKQEISLNELLNKEDYDNLKVNAEIIPKTEDVKFYGNPEESKIILNELITNSKKQGATKLDIKVYNNPSNYEIILEDNGSGISEKKLEEITSKLNKPQPKNTISTGNSGFGLQYVKNIIEKEFNGSYSIKSKGVGEGTTQRIYIPKN